MMRRWLAGLGMALIAVALGVGTARAGGWATVTLDRPIGEVRAGQMIEVGFVVKQHGETPIHQAYGQPLEATVIAKQPESKEGFSVRATPDSLVGHFTARVTFPSVGLWIVEIMPAPFAGTRLGGVTVLTPSGGRPAVPAGTASAQDEAAIGQAAPARTAVRSDGGSARDTVIAVSVLALVVLGVGALLLAGRGWRTRFAGR